MSDGVKVSVDDSEALNLIRVIQSRAMNASIPLRKAALVMHKDVMNRFETESDEKGTPWRPIALTKQTMKRRKMLNKSGTKVLKSRTIVKILQDTGTLKRSIKASSNNQTATVSTDVIYAAIHNFGGKTGRNKSVNMPARPFMRDLSQSAKDTIVNMLFNYLSKKD